MSAPQRFRKKPVVIEAMHLAANRDEVASWVRNYGGDVSLPDVAPSGVIYAPGVLCVHTLEGEMWAEDGDWIIRGVAGEFYPCKPDIFAATYEPADGSTPSPSPVESGEELEWRCSKCGGSPESHAPASSECVYDPILTPSTASVPLPELEALVEAVDTLRRWCKTET